MAKDRTFLSQFYDEANVVKIQAFIRGCFCRARVLKMVQKLIDGILLRRKTARRITVEDGNSSYDEIEIIVDSDDDDFIENSTTGSLDLMETFANKTKSSNAGSMHASVSDMLGKLEANRDPNAPVPTRNFGSKKKQEPENTTKEPTIEEGPKITLKNPEFVSNATIHVTSSEQILQEQEARLNEELQQLLKDIRRIGERGKPRCNYGELFDDEKVANYYEALLGTLKAAKKKGLISYNGQILLKGVNDDEVIKIL